MGFSPLVRFAILLCFAGSLTACGHTCGLAEHGRVTVQSGVVPCCGGAKYEDVSLKGQTSDAEFSLSNTNLPTQPGGVDAFIVPTSCQTLFDGPYPGASPLCSILAGPAKPGGVSPRAKLTPGTYRVYLQGYSNVTAPVGFVVDVYIWDYSCGPTIR